MTTTVQLRRGTKTANDAFTGAVGELTVDLVTKNIRLHDGSTAGGNSTIMASQVGQASGVAALDSGGKVPSAQVPTTFAAMTVNGLFATNDTLTGSSPTVVHAISVTESIAAGSGFQIASTIIATKTGGTGHREALHVEQLSSTSAVGEFVVGIQGHGRLTGGSGSVFGMNGYVWVDAAAAATAEAAAAEFNTDIRRSGGIVRKVGIQIVDVSTSVGAGTSFDCGVFMTKQSGGIGFTAGIQFGDSSQFPVRAGGHLITLGAAGVAPTLATGINLAALPAPTIGAFISPPSAKGLSFGLTGEGGLIQSTTNASGGVLSFGNGTIGVNTSFEATGYIANVA
ncbi:hyaluronate lyase N-terminal domain-containing protein [Rhizobium rhizogenes]|uniref:hyaluronate lyase N-terminal domain-containing protein n=1 Tax=Rhizobium rhizogenes TaxID=359 RepID=UPI001572520F|nr:hypothetical protein [Rhizobium rhizogenes]NTI74874.1 hypothetical protein [Rhizobium rhizogenes]